MRQVETYQAVILITQLTSSGKFCKINEWSNLSLTAILGWVKNPPKKIRKPPFTSQQMRQIKCPSRGADIGH